MLRLILIWVAVICGTAISSAQAEGRIGVRVVDGAGEFYSVQTGTRFYPRGVNYLDFRRANGIYQDRVLDARFDPDRIATAMQTLRAHGYNTIRVFFDLCNRGPGCITDQERSGLNPHYMDRMAALTRLADEYGIHILFTSNDIPDFGGYGEIANRDESDLIAGYRNAHYFSAGGVAAFETYWRDIMAAMAARDTAWSAVLGWSLVNEQWTFRLQPPLSLSAGTITNGTGRSYDLSDPDQKRAALADNLNLMTERVSAIIKTTDPEALVTMGFFAPQFPNETGIGGDWHVDTEPLLAGATLDFFDFHAYVDMDLPIARQAENFGMTAHPDRPVIMGEVGSSPSFIPQPQTARGWNSNGWPKAVGWGLTAGFTGDSTRSRGAWIHIRHIHF